MTHSNMYPVKAVGISRVMIHGSFLPTAGANPTVNDGVGWSVVRSALGVYTVTLNEPINELTSLLSSLQLTTPGIYTLCNGLYTVATRSFTIAAFLETAGTLAAEDLNNAVDGSVVSFLAVCRNTNITN